MSLQFDKLKTLLRELFQLDQPDLDFGFYRIMHAKSAEVTEFLDKDLLPQVKSAFAEYHTADKSVLQRELAQAIEQAQSLGADPHTLPKVKALRERLANEAVDVTGLEAEVYDHLYSFFRRYYSEGDFLSKRVYKPGVYAIPYEGEEVKLHWANADQYYIKTSEYLRDYAFRLKPDDLSDPMRVHFRLVDAAEGEHGNVKETEGKGRVFVLAGGDFVSEVDGEQGKELAIRFEYRPATIDDWPETERRGKTKPPAQKDLLSIADARIVAAGDVALARWIQLLNQPHLKTDGETADYSRLRAHLNRYAARNTFDYFIHKDLGGFLRRELDFYIKNEVMHLDDIENESAPRVEQYLSKIKVIRKIAGKITEFLASLEDFQKKLWLKKKFIVETRYCVTLDRVPESFYPEIAASAAQQKDWTRLFLLEPAQVDVAFLKSNRQLVLDTAFFSDDFQARLISEIGSLDSEVGAILVHGDNYQALRLLNGRFKSQIKCAYIDPPYNTSASAILYKNDYRHSSWGTLMRDRIDVASRLLREDGAMFVSIDKVERTILEYALDDVFGPDNHIEELIWTQATANSQLPNYSTNHEYVEVYAKSRSAVERDAEMFREPKPGYAEVMDLLVGLVNEYPPLRDIETAIKQLFADHLRSYKDEWEATGQDWDAEAKRQDPWRGIYPYNKAEYRSADGEFVPEDDARSAKATIWVWSEISAAAPASKQSRTTKDPNHFNFRYYKPLHPVTGKECPHPRSGWKFPLRADPDSPTRRSFEEFAKDQRIAWGEDEAKLPRTKGFLHEVESNIGTSVFYAYNDGESELSDLFGESGLFLSPKSSSFVQKFVRQATRKDDWFVDFFGGSGSSGHAVIAQNRLDGGTRKQILVEIGEHFDSILLPRIKKVSYSPAWKAGRPSPVAGGNQVLKYVRLESYEDALNNLEVRRTSDQQSLLDVPDAKGFDGLREQYMLRYMLDAETRGSQSLLNVAAFMDPRAYRLKVKRPGSDESRDVNVDLLETFNWLVGITVRHLAAPQTFSAEFKRDDDADLPKNAVRRLLIDGRLKADPDSPWWFRTVTGTTPDGRKTLVIWRTRPGGDSAEGVEQDNLVLDTWFEKQGYSSKDSEFDLIYVNGGNNLENLKAPDDTWKVRLIEEDFHRLMFDTEDV